MDLKLFNTLGHRVQKFIAGRAVNLYTCGPTVYNNAHIGNLRAYFTADILRRTLKFNGYNTRWVINITDIDDKTIANTIKKEGSKANTKDLRQFTDVYFRKFLGDLKKINIDPGLADFVKVSDKIEDIKKFIINLLKKGYAYRADDGSTYFSIQKYQDHFGDYGQLVGKKFLAGKKIGARVKVDEYDKDNLSDFALWKARGNDDGEIFWDDPALGKGRPGWHIECTVINYLKFKRGTDIHTGGVDLIFPHHSNEITQAQPIYRPFVKFWVHSEHILVNNKKMAKSAGNFYTLSDLEQKQICSGLDLRYLFLQSHYKNKLNITVQSLKSAREGLANIRKEVGKLMAKTNKAGEPIKKIMNKFNKAINDNLDTPRAIAILSEIFSLNKNVQSTPASSANKLATIYQMDKIFGLDLKSNFIQSEKLLSPQQFTSGQLNNSLNKLLEQRQQARKDKNYALSDKLRKDIEKMGYQIIDTKDGVKIKSKPA